MNSGSGQLTSVADNRRLVELVDVITSRLPAGASLDFESYAAEFLEHADHLQRWIAATRAILQLGESFQPTGAGASDSDAAYVQVLRAACLA